jgi:hypothetical protein
MVISGEQVRILEEAVVANFIQLERLRKSTKNVRRFVLSPSCKYIALPVRKLLGGKMLKRNYDH